MNGVNAEALVPFECGKAKLEDSKMRSGSLLILGASPY